MEKLSKFRKFQEGVGGLRLVEDSQPHLHMSPGESNPTARGWLRDGKQPPTKTGCEIILHPIHPEHGTNVLDLLRNMLNMLQS